MGEYNYLVQQFRSQEGARWKNKIENNRLDNEINGKGGIEDVRAFHLRSVDKEKRRIEEELEAIRRHGRRRTVQKISKPEILTTSLNPPLNTPERNREKYSLASRYSHKAVLSGYYDLSLIPSAQALRESQITDQQKTPSSFQQDQNDSLVIRFDDPDIKSTPTTHTVEGSEYPLSNPIVYHRQHMVQFVDEEHLTHSKGKGSKFRASGVYYPASSWGSGASKWVGQHTSSDGVDIVERGGKAGRESVAKRLTEKTADTGTPPRDSVDHSAAESVPENSSGPEDAGDMATHGEKVQQGDSADTKTRRTSKTNNTDILKGSKFDADMYNPDGSLRTKHCVPSFEDAYEQARKARYIRSKERSELDRELDINEVFDKSKGQTDKPKPDSA